MAIIKAVKFSEEQKAVLEKHLKNGGEFAKEALAATDTALEVLRKHITRVDDAIEEATDEQRRT